jgi:GNAT superfamily N-acetyltransferase
VVKEGTTAPVYAFGPVDLSPAGLVRSAALLRRVFPAAHHLTPDYLAWLYGGNPAGAAVGVEAVLDGEPVAHYVTVPFPARVHGAARAAALGLNLAVHPAHRGKGLAAEVVGRASEQCCAQQTTCLVAVLNANSTHLFTERLGFQLVRSLEARLGVGARGRRADAPAVDFERLWDDASVTWRLANPSIRYALRGREVLAPSGYPGIAVSLGEVEHPVASEGSAGGPLTLWLGLDPAVHWGRSAYLPLPERLRPSPLNLVFRDAAEPGRRLDPARVRFRGLDFDAY